jgi:hypothetical protein
LAPDCFAEPVFGPREAWTRGLAMAATGVVGKTFNRII